MIRACRELVVFSCCLLCAFDAAAADPVKLQIAVEAGNHDRLNTPVRATVTLPASTDPAAVKIASLVDADGKPVPVQVTKPSLPGALTATISPERPWELHFVLPALKAGKTATYSAIVRDEKPGQDPSSASARFEWHDVPGEHSELTFGGRSVVRYMCRKLDESSPEARMATFKVFHHVYDPSGRQIVTNGGEAGLYPHHRGLFFGFNKVTYDNGKECDIWHCKEGSHQSHEGILSAEAGTVLARHRAAVDWHGVAKEVFGKEDREVTVYNLPGGTLIDFASQVRTTGGPIKLDGDPQHAGFHFRASADVAANTKGQTYYLRPDGPGQPGETRNWDPKTRMGPVNLPWDAMSFVLGDKRYTVAYLDRPQNPKEARFSERDYGRFGSYFEYEVTPEKPLNIAYRVWLQDGEMTGNQVAALANDFVEPPRVSVKADPSSR